MADTVQKGDIGTKILVDCDEDLTGFVSGIIYYRKPGGAKGSWTALREGVLNKIYFVTTLVTDLDVVGTWCLQSYADLGPGKKWRGTKSTELVVEANC